MQLAVTGFSKLWQRLLRNSASVKLDSTNLFISRNGKAASFHLNDIEQFDIQKGWFLNALMITVTNQTPIILKDYKSEQLNQVLKTPYLHR